MLWAYEAYDAYEEKSQIHRMNVALGNVGESSSADSFHRPRTPSTAAGGPPPSKREVLGFRRSRPAALPSIGYRGFAVAPMTLRASSRSLLYNPGCRVATLLVSKGVMGFLGDLREDRIRARPVGGSARRSIPSEREATLLRPLSAVNRNLPGNSHSRASAPCDFRFPPCFFPHSGRMAPIPLIP